MDREQKEILNQLDTLSKDEKIVIIEKLLSFQTRKTNEIILRNLLKNLK